MQTIETLQAKADRAESRSKKAYWSAGAMVLYSGLSLVDHESSQPKTPYDMTLGWAIDLVDLANSAASFFLENALSIKIPAKTLGAVVGGISAIGLGLYGFVQRNKMLKFQAQANEMSGKNVGNSQTAKDLTIQ